MMTSRDIQSMMSGFAFGGALIAIFHVSGFFPSRVEKNLQSQLSSLESRIARQEEIIEHHIKKAAFDSTNQVQAFKKIGK